MMEGVVERHNHSEIEIKIQTEGKITVYKWNLTSLVGKYLAAQRLSRPLGKLAVFYPTHIDHIQRTKKFKGFLLLDSHIPTTICGKHLFLCGI